MPPSPALPKMYFNPRSPRGERLSISVFRFWRRFDFNPRSPRGERLILTNRSLIRIRISIHAPREGSDVLIICFWSLFCRFQSTLPARGATKALDTNKAPMQFQSTLPARGATLARRKSRWQSGISIHAPREGSDAVVKLTELLSEQFQSTLPARGATSILTKNCAIVLNFNPRSPRGERRGCCSDLRLLADFNPRSPRGERHGVPGSVFSRSRNFNPRSPRGERPANMVLPLPGKPFQSTLPARGATAFADREQAARRFQSTLPARGATRNHRLFSLRRQAYFNPRSPRGERHLP